jgi:hypothetical protein
MANNEESSFSMIDCDSAAQCQLLTDTSPYDPMVR